MCVCAMQLLYIVGCIKYVGKRKDGEYINVNQRWMGFAWRY